MLDGAKVGTGFEHVRRAGVAEQVRVYGLLDAGPLTGLSAGVANRVIVEGSAGPHGRGEQPGGWAIPLAIDRESLL